MMDEANDELLIRLLLANGLEECDDAVARIQTLKAERDAARDAALEEAARIAETLGVHPQLNVWGGGPDWFKHGKNIAADLEKAWEMGRDAAAREAFIACAETRHVTLARVAEDRASALTPPADLAQRVKE